MADSHQFKNCDISLVQNIFRAHRRPASGIFTLKLFNSMCTFCIIVPNFVEISHTVAEISGFFCGQFFW